MRASLEEVLSNRAVRWLLHHMSGGRDSKAHRCPLPHGGVNAYINALACSAPGRLLGFIMAVILRDGCSSHTRRQRHTFLHTSLLSSRLVTQVCNPSTCLCLYSLRAEETHKASTSVSLTAAKNSQRNEGVGVSFGGTTTERIPLMTGDFRPSSREAPL